jgi:hypothetical protein
MIYKFIKIKDPDNEHDVSSVEMTVETESLGKLLEEFELFLKASGFYIKGRVDIVEE